MIRPGNRKRSYSPASDFHRKKRSSEPVRIKDRIQFAAEARSLVGQSGSANATSGGFLWNGGSAVQWNLAKAKLVLKLQAENCWHIMTSEDQELPQVPDLNTKVEEIIASLMQNNEDARDTKQHRIEEMHNAGMLSEAKFREKILDIETKYEDEALRIKNSELAIRTQIMSEVKTTEDRVLRILADRAKCIKVLEKCLGPGPMSYIRAILSEGQVSVAWQMLDQRYNDPSQIGNLSQVSQTLSTMVFDPYREQFDEHIAMFESLVEILDQADQALNEAEKVGKLRSSIERGSTAFDDTLELCLFSNYGYEQIKTAIKAKIAEMNRKDYERSLLTKFTANPGKAHGIEQMVEDAVEQHVAHSTSATTGFQGKCFNCGKYGHRADRCPKQTVARSTELLRKQTKQPHRGYVICDFCGRSGHHASNCWYKQKHMRTNGVHSSAESAHKVHERGTVNGNTRTREVSSGKSDIRKLFQKKVESSHHTRVWCEDVQGAAADCEAGSTERAYVTTITECDGGTDHPASKGENANTKSNDKFADVADTDEMLVAGCEQLETKESLRKESIDDGEKVDDKVACHVTSSHGQRYLLDSGSTNHMTSDKSHLTNYTPRKGLVVFGDGSATKFYGTGQLGRFHGAIWVPKLKEGLISVSKLDELGHKIVIQNSKARILDTQGNLIASATKANGLYYMDDMHTACVSRDVQSSSAELTLKGQAPMKLQSTVLGMNKLEALHNRWGHLSAESIKRALREQLVIGAGVSYDEIKDLNMRMCPDCQKCRMTALSTPSSDTVYEHLNPMEHLATDDKGPFSVKTIHGYVRFDLFSFRSSKYLVAKFKRHKSDFLANLQDVVRFAEMADQTVRVLQTDDDEKMYGSLIVRRWCEKKRIALHRASAYKHEQNGWIERDMRSVLEKARTLMMVYSSPLRFWDYAVDMAVYLINRSPSSHNGKTPYEMVTGVKPDISQLVPFYAPGVYHLTNAERKHGWGAKAEECRMLGYEDKNLYLIYVPRTQAILRRRDCRFDESSEFTQSPSLHQEDLLRHYPVLRQANKGDLTIADQMDFFDDTPYFDPDDDNDDNVLDDMQVDMDNNADEDTRTLEHDETSLRELANVSADNPVSKSLALPVVPSSLEEALRGPDRENWIKAVDAELKQLVDRRTFEYAGEAGPGAKSKLILSVKYDNNMEVKYKARLVLCGYSQVKGLDYNKTFAPTISKTPVFIILHIAAIRGWSMQLIDVGNAFLEGKNDFDIYMYVPRSILPPNVPPVRVKVLNSLYGEKQAAHIWNERLNVIFVDYADLERCLTDPCVYIKRNDQGRVVMIVTVHVDDILIVGESRELVQSIVDIVRQNVMKVTHYDEFKKYLNVDLHHDIESNSVYISQTQYVDEILSEFHDQLDVDLVPEIISKNRYNVPISPSPRGALTADNTQTSQESEDEEDIYVGNNHLSSLLPFVGKTRYLVDNSRPDLLAAIGIMSEGAKTASPYMRMVCRDFLRYLARDKDKGLKLGGHEHEMELFGYCDASYVNTGTCKSRLGGCFFISKDSGAIHCFSKKDTTVSHSSTEAEVKAIDMAIRSAAYIRELLLELGCEQRKPTKLYVDNKSAIDICETLKVGHKTRHINVRLQYIREQVNARAVELVFVPSEQNVADILTKPLHITAFHRCQEKLLHGFTV